MLWQLISFTSHLAFCQGSAITPFISFENRLEFDKKIFHGRSFSAYDMNGFKAIRRLKGGSRKGTA